MSKVKSYRELKAELDELLLSFETSSHDDVEAMLKDYNAANTLIKELQNRLEKAELALKKSTKE